MRAFWIPSLAVIALAAAPRPAATRPPNVVIILADDMGYGDLGAFGHPTIRTPRLDRMASEGQKWTSFYVAESVCTPSRAALLTGRLPIRTGMNPVGEERRVLFPDSTGGLPASEITIADLLKKRGYAAIAIGKWHLGHLPPFLPMAHGFDQYFGIPYSNDMEMAPIPGTPTMIGGEDPRKRGRMMDPKVEYWNVPLMRGSRVVERPADQSTITRRYTEEAVGFIRAHASQPFFVYLAHTMPHMPLFASPAFAGKSARGRYGDVIEEIDWSVGQVLDTLRALGLERRTLVIFSSDNGPWTLFDEQGGSAGPLRGGKGATFEGGMREPTIFWWPGTIAPAVVMDLGTTMDLLPTLAALAGVSPPTDRILDGFDLSAVLRGRGKSPRQDVFYYRGPRLYALRHGAYKAHFFTRSEYGGEPEAAHEPPLLYNLDEDPGERYDVAARHPEVVAEIRRIAAEHARTLQPVENQLDKRAGP
ncbi:MAG TPA: sulfatase [Vicinamibacteria bacterium]|jgi:arylsulfatase A|nr:sulfatase [Vicinamibacteria bacterium]